MPTCSACPRRQIRWDLLKADRLKAGECHHGAVQVVNPGRAVKHRLLEISRAAKSLTTAGRQRMRDRYQPLVALTRSVVRQAGDVLRRWAAGRA